MMETLNLVLHDPEEFEGKMVNIHGCNYVVGPYISTGGEKVVHKLINLQSGLCLHVIKFWRQPDQELIDFSTSKYAYLKAIEFVSRALRVPPTTEIRANGGAFQLQEILGNIEEDSNPTSSMMEQALELIKSSRIEEAIIVYEETLQINPYHTQALHNLAYANFQLGDIDTAYRLESNAIIIEPNCLSYFSNYIRYSAICGQLRACAFQFSRMKTLFPYHYDMYDLGIDIYLNLGYPEEAVGLLEEVKVIILNDHMRSWFEGEYANQFKIELDRFSEIEESVKAEAAAKKNASYLYEQARDMALHKTGDDFEVIKILESAYQIYNRFPFLSVNLGLAFQRTGDFNRSKEFLLSALSSVPHNAISQCFANVAFADIKALNYDEAILSLDAVMTDLLLSCSEEDSIESVDLPGNAIWIDEEFTIETQINGDLVNLIERAIINCNKKELITENFIQLVALYKKAAAMR